MPMFLRYFFFFFRYYLSFLTIAKKPQGVRLVPTRTSSRATFPTPTLPPIARLNQLDRSVLQHSINLLFETAPPLFEPLWERRPYLRSTFHCLSLILHIYESYEQLIDTAESVIRTLSPEDRLTVINAHPRIGLNPAQLSSLSKKEQGNQNDVIYNLPFHIFLILTR